MATEVSKPLIYSFPLELEYYFSKNFWPVIEILLLLLCAKLSRKTNIFSLLILQIKDTKKKHSTCFVYFKPVGWAACMLARKGGIVEGDRTGNFEMHFLFHYTVSFVNKSQVPSGDYFR